MSLGDVESLVDRQVTYTVEVNGKFFLIENVPARIDLDSGEQFFSPIVVERIQQIILDRKAPTRFTQTPVYEFAA